jgi:hypothetical protein
MGKSMTNFRAEDMPGWEAEAPAPVQEVRESVEQSASAEEKVPSGSAADVLRWVNGDPTRAQRALDAENSGSNPRKGLKTELEEIVAK